MTNHVPTLATCQKLAEIGYPQDISVFSWSGFGLSTKPWIVYRPVSNNYNFLCAAPILTELLENLPTATKLAKGFHRGEKSYVVCLKQNDKMVPFESLASKDFYKANPAEAAALLYLELRNKGGL